MKNIFSLTLLFSFVFYPFVVFGVSLQPYYITKITSQDRKISIKDKYDEGYTIKYGPECDAVFKYRINDVVYINATGYFLDGLGDIIYFGDKTQYCRIWSSEHVRSGPGFYSIYSAQTVCPDNGHLTTERSRVCECDDGYGFNFNKSACIPVERTAQEVNNDLCVKTFGPNGIWDGTTLPDGTLNCACRSGYEWNDSATSCVAKKAVPVKANTEPKVNANTQTSFSEEKPTLKTEPVQKPETEVVQKPEPVKTPEPVQKEEVKKTEVKQPQPKKQYIPLYKRIFNWFRSL